MTDLSDTFIYYSNLMKKDFIMTDFDDSILSTASLFNTYTTNPSDFVQNKQHVKKIPVSDKKTTKNKKKRINIPNARITRHNHIRPRSSNRGKSDNNDTNEYDTIEI